MKLQFKKSVLSCLDTALREKRSAEQTQEIKLPDSMPDIGHIIAAWGQCILRGKEWRSSEIGFSGGMMVWVLYAPEDGSRERCIDAWIPFQMKWDLPDGTPEGRIRMTAVPRFVDARSVSPRKIMVRAGMSAMAEAFAPMEAEVFAPEESQAAVELLRSTYPVRLPMEAGEKTFLMDEDLTLPASAPQPESIIYFRLNPRITDKKDLGNKVVFRGNGNLHTLYRSEEGQLHSWDFELPFSQYAELDGEHGTDAMADIVLSPTSLELELDDEGHMRFKGGIVAQYLISDKQMVEVVEDAYSPGRELQMQSQELELPAVLENRRENIYGEQTLPAEANLTADVSFSPDLPRQRRSENGVELEFPGTFQVLYYGEDGILRSGTARWEGSQTLRADENSQITVLPTPAEPQAVVGSGQILLKADIPLELTVDTRQRIPMVTGVELGEQREADPNRPTLILRRAGESRLWDIAKKSGSTMEAIRKANNLQNEPTPGQILLIPVG